jgi:hypothetical protein
MEITEQTTTSSTSKPPLPAAWVERIFEVMAAVYGRQRLGTMFDGQEPDMVKKVWGRALAALPSDAVAAAVHRLPEQAWTWPPTLPEFVAFAREQIPPAAHRPALPVPNRRQADIEIGAQKAAALKAAVSDRKDPRAWAHKILERHAAGDSTLAPITIQFAREALNKPAFGGDA